MSLLYLTDRIPFVVFLHLSQSMSATSGILHRLVFCVAFSVIVPQALANEDLGYVLAPLSTELHRAEVSSKASAILIVSGNAIASSPPDELTGIHLQNLQSDLRTMSARKNEFLLIRIQCTDNQRLHKDDAARFMEKLNVLAKACGFLESKASVEWTSALWDMGTASLGTGLLDDHEDENLIVDETLIAAPLRTRISKLLVADGDAFVRLRHTFDGRNQSISDHSSDAIRNAVESMEPIAKHRLIFDITSTTAGVKAVEEIFSNRRPPDIPKDSSPAIREFLQKERESFKLSQALRIAQELGFQEIGYIHTPCGGAPELLLDSPAPSFELKGLGGGTFQWPSLSEGRPALITFWGVACGPCRLEAPHLTRLHEKYSDRIAILAINAYEESEETIQEFVTDKSLKHPIAIGGAKLAKASFQVASYPTTFWINRRGEVVRYEIGFENGDDLEKQLIEFISQDSQLDNTPPLR